MNKTTLTGVTISQLQRAHGWRRYFWPIRSWVELRSITTMLTTLLLVAIALVLCVKPAALWSVLSGGTIGGFLFGVYGVLPARLILATQGEARHHLADLQAHLLSKGGFVDSTQPSMPGSHLYRSKLPRWFICDAHDNLKVEVREHEMVLTGPIICLFLLRAQLLLPDDHAYLKA